MNADSPIIFTLPKTRRRPNWNAVVEAQDRLEDAQNVIARQEGTVAALRATVGAQARQIAGYRKWQLPLIGFGALLGAFVDTAWRALV